MCTAISYQSTNHYFGRNLDLEYSFKEEVTITPRNFPLHFCGGTVMHQHFSMIGIATVSKNYPLYYDATNEAGLSVAALNFPGNAIYFPEDTRKDNIAPYALIPWILGQCKSVSEAATLLKKVNIINISFSKEYPLTPLHWLIADKEKSVTVEQTESGLHVYSNPVGVLANNPSFDYHMHNLQNYSRLTNQEPACHIYDKPYSRGLGGFGLPGDLTSPSRFVRAAFTKEHSITNQTDTADVSQFFHILSSVEQTEGCVKADKGFVKTVYSSCCNTDKCIYYYTTYENRQITGVHLHHTDLNCQKLSRYPLIRCQQIYMQN